MNRMGELKEAMKDSISEILETMFFTPVEFSEEQDLNLLIRSREEPVVSAQLIFNGPFAGNFSVFAPVPLAKELTANLLGLEEENLGREQIEATIKELLNMVAGKTFSLYDSQSVFDLGVPDMVEATELPPVASNGQKNEITVIVETVSDILGFRLAIG